MLVLADIEWIQNEGQVKQPTQLAAVRVDSRWNPTGEFDSFICPYDISSVPSWHIAFTGGKENDFLSAPDVKDVICSFMQWLEEDDKVIWWHHESEELMCRLINVVSDNRPGMASVNRFVYGYMNLTERSGADMYSLARGMGVKTKTPMKHNSKNDVRVFRELMAAINYPQSEIMSIPNERLSSASYHPTYMFRYDPATNRIHKADCSLIAGTETVCYEYLKTAVRKGFIPCECCKKEYREIIRQRNIRTIQHNGFRFVYSPDSSVFHKSDCGLILYAKQINGSPKYETVACTGRKPCSLCKPAYRDSSCKFVADNKTVRRAKLNPGALKSEYARALERRKVAAKERSIKLNSEDLTQDEKNDILTLTQPRFAFWASRGYGNFHKHSCPKLNQMSNLVGFGTYNEAVAAGYTPCRKCKPTKKNDAVYSVPLGSHTRENETSEDLISLCQGCGYKYSEDIAFFCIETPVGKWRLDTSSIPVKLEHINFVKTPGVTKYHEQPCIFLSLTDAFFYIKKHDDELEAKKANGKAYVILIRDRT